MKYLKYLLIIVTLLVVLFFGKGFLTPAVSYECEVMVNKPIKAMPGANRNFFNIVCLNDLLFCDIKWMSLVL